MVPFVQKGFSPNFKAARLFKFLPKQQQPHMLFEPKFLPKFQSSRIV
jgi:hypothetical protein